MSNPTITENWPATVALPGVVSEGTLNPEHLIPIFARLVREIDPELFVRNKGWCALCLSYAIDGRLGEHSFGLHDAEDQQNTLTTLWEVLEKLAPEGYYFGSIEGDGACIGFFEQCICNSPHESTKCLVHPTCQGDHGVDDEWDGTLLLNVPEDRS